MKAAYMLLFAAGLCLAGCAQQEIATGEHVAQADGLVVTLESPQHDVLVPGENLSLIVTVRNTTKQPAEIVARSGAPVYARVWRRGEMYWQQVKTYPQAATMVMTPWTLPAREQRTFMLSLPVEPDWPTGEPLRITAELNGRPQAKPAIIVRVARPVLR